MSDVRSTQYFRGTDTSARHVDSVQPRFHYAEVQDPLATAAQGRPIFRSEERVQHLIPGGLSQFVERVNDEHRNRWPEQYRRFKEGTEVAVDGTPIDQWSILNRSQVLELKALQIFSIEQCALLSDTAVQKIGMGGSAIRSMAKAYLDEAEDQALNLRLLADKDASDAKIAAQDRQIAELKALMEGMHAQLMTLQSTPHPIATFQQSQHDPMEAMRQMGGGSDSTGGTSLDALAKRGPGRPRKNPLPEYPGEAA